MLVRGVTQARRAFRVCRASAVTLVRRAILAVKARKEIWVPRVRQARREMWVRQVLRAISVHRVPEGFPARQALVVLQALWVRRA